MICGDRVKHCERPLNLTWYRFIFNSNTLSPEVAWPALKKNKKNQTNKGSLLKLQGFNNYFVLIYVEDQIFMFAHFR